MRSQALFQATLLGFFCVAELACSRAEFFKAPIALSDGVRGRSWRAPLNLELDPDTPLVDSAGRSFFGFDFAVEPEGKTGVLVFSAATSAGNTNRVPVGRLYTAAGFAEPGPSFGGMDATPSSYTFVSVVRGVQTGDFLASFTLAGTQQRTFYGANLGDSGSTWSAPRTRTLFAPRIASASDYRSGPPLSGEFDILGRGFFQLVGGAGTWSLLPYDLGNASGLGAALSSPTGTDARMVKDSVGRIFSLNLAAGGLEVAFLDAVTGALGASTVALGATAGIAAAADDQESVMILGASGGALHSWLATEGTLDPAGVVIDSQVGTWSAGTRPAVVDLGRGAGTTLGARGKYLAVWVSLVGGTSQVLSATYDRESRLWSAPVPVTSSEPFSAAPKHVALRLAAYPNGNAVLAVSHLQAEGASPVTHVWDVQVARFNMDSGWLPAETVGDGCVGDLVCSHLPAVGVLATGDAVVIFPDQDGSAQYRLRGIEFRK